MEKKFIIIFGNQIFTILKILFINMLGMLYISFLEKLVYIFINFRAIEKFAIITFGKANVQDEFLFQKTGIIFCFAHLSDGGKNP